MISSPIYSFFRENFNKWASSSKESSNPSSLDSAITLYVSFISSSKRSSIDEIFLLISVVNELIVFSLFSSSWIIFSLCWFKLLPSKSNSIVLRLYSWRFILRISFEFSINVFLFEHSSFISSLVFWTEKTLSIR